MYRYTAAWQLFNFGFIATYQNLLLLLIALPSAAAWRQRGTPSATLNALDGLAAAAMVIFLVLESVADQQQWTFQQSKHRAVGLYKLNPVDPWLETRLVSTLGACEVKTGIPSLPFQNGSTCAATARPGLCGTRNSKTTTPAGF